MEPKQYEQDLAVSLESLNRAAARLAFLSEAGHTLTSSLNLNETFQRLVRLVVPTIADWCTITLVTSGNKIERLALAHADPEKERLLRETEKRFPPNPDADTGPPYSIRTGKPEFVLDLQGEAGVRFLDRYCDNPDFKRIISQVGITSFMSIPMKLEDGTVIGAIWLARNRPKPVDQFTEDDLALSVDLAAIAAKAVRNSTLYQQAVDRTERLEIERKFRDEYIRKQIHDIKTPLTAATLVIDLLERKAKGQERVTDLAKNARENIRRTVQMIDNISKHHVPSEDKRKAA